MLEHELFAKGVPYKVYGGLRFFERQEIKHALAYLRLLGNPDDDTAFLRVVNFPTRGIGARSLENLQATAHQMNSSLYNAAASLTGKAGADGRRFHPADRDPAPGNGRTCHCRKWSSTSSRKSGLAQHYRIEKEGQERLENLDELINAAATFVDDEGVVMTEAGEGGALASFLAHASLEAGEHQAGEGQEAVQLMSVHAAKGLEFDVVFITGLEQGLFPHENSVDQGREGLEEERRLMYVARDPRPPASLRLLRADPHAARPDALLRALGFLDEIPGNLAAEAEQEGRAGSVSGLRLVRWRLRRAGHRLAACASGRRSSTPSLASASSSPPKDAAPMRASRSISAAAA